MDVDGAKLELEQACSMYCRWYDTGSPDMSGTAVAYELVTFCRTALSRLQEPVEQAGRDDGETT